MAEIEKAADSGVIPPVYYELDALLAAVRRAVFAERDACLAAVRSERLEDPQDETDEAYQRALDDAEAAIRARSNQS